MDPNDLDLRDLLTASVRGGLHSFASRRVLLIHSGALWVMRRQLVETVGRPKSRQLLTQLGCAWGWETADAAGDAVPWSEPQLWSDALPRLQAILGLGKSGAGFSAQGSLLSQLEWSDSFEAQHFRLENEGPSSQPVCWLLSGFASGYLSRTLNAAITYHEERCIAMGDPTCRFAMSPADEHDSEATPCVEMVDRLRRHPMTSPVLNGSHGPNQLEFEGGGIHAELRSPAMSHTLHQATRVAPLETTVVIIGESGVGKERLAQYIHEYSRRRKPFVAINCGALSETLLESELFGHARGAFTGAVHDHPGLFEAANGGTIFLDEIAEMPLSMQVKLLRVIQEREVRRVGETKPRRIDVRIIVATNRELHREVAAKRFRDDLFYRLRVVELRVPPLRDRPEDLRVLIRTFLDRTIAKASASATGFTPRALDALLRYRWPGNVRELENAIQRACALASGPLIDIADLPDEVRNPTETPAAAEPVRSLLEVEREHVMAVLARNEGNKVRTAEQLGIAPGTLYRMLARYARRIPSQDS